MGKGLHLVQLTKKIPGNRVGSTGNRIAHASYISYSHYFIYVIPRHRFLLSFVKKKKFSLFFTFTNAWHFDPLLLSRPIKHATRVHAPNRATFKSLIIHLLLLIRYVNKLGFYSLE